LKTLINQKRILIVSAGFYPKTTPRALRTTELAIELSKQGHEVTVYFPTEGFYYKSFEEKHNLRIFDLGPIRFKEVRLKGNKTQLLIRRLIRRILQLAFEWPSIQLMFKVVKKLKIENGYDLIISIAVPYPIHWGVAFIYRRKHRIAKCWVADCGDPYMGDTTDSFRKFFYFKYVEKWFCNKADFITVPFKGAISAYYPEFHEKIRVIPQGFSFDKLNLPVYKKTSTFPVFAYAGSFIPGIRDPREMLKFLSACDRSFKFIVYTSQKEMFVPFMNTLKEKLEIRDIISHDELLKVLAGMDFLVNFDNNTKSQLPSKLIDYSIAGRPVLNITSNFDFSILLEFMDGIYNKRMLLDSPSNYDIREIAKKFIEISNNI